MMFLEENGLASKNNKRNLRTNMAHTQINQINMSNKGLLTKGLFPNQIRKKMNKLRENAIIAGGKHLWQSRLSLIAAFAKKTMW